MRAILALALLVTGAPVAAASGVDNGNQNASASSQRRVCTRVQQRGASRLSERRICLTENEWRDRLGPDWRLALSGRNVEDDMDSVGVQTRAFSNLPGAATPP